MQTMKFRQIFMITAAITMLFLAGCGGNNDETADQGEKKVSVKGEIISYTNAALTKEFTGTIEGARQAVMTAKIAEAVEELPAKEGALVKANDILIRLDRTGPTSNYIQAYSVFQNSEKNYTKMKYLFEEGAVSETQFDAARTEYEVAKANYDAARQTVDIKTPIAGMVTSIEVSPGDYLYPGQKVATVASMEKLRRMRSGMGISWYYVLEDRNTRARSLSRAPCPEPGRFDRIAASPPCPGHGPEGKEPL